MNLKIVSCEEMKLLEETAYNNYHINEQLIIENVGAQAAQLILREKKYRQFLLLVGKGNNGSDALALGRHLLRHQQVKVFALLLMGERRDDAQWAMARAYGVQEVLWKEAEALLQDTRVAVIDGLFGIGFKAPLHDADLSKKLQSINRWVVRKRLWSLDIPSGVQGNDGVAITDALRAGTTIVVGAPKWGHLLGDGPHFVGKMQIIDAGFPRDVLSAGRSAVLLSPQPPKFPARSALAYKNSFGHVLIIGGSPGLTGAPLMSAMAAQAMGAGLVSVLTHQESYDELTKRMSKKCDFMLQVPKETGSKLSKYQAILIGPGLGLDEKASKLLQETLMHHRGPLILDADAITLSTELKLSDASCSTLAMTPHIGEMARLLKIKKEEVLTPKGLSLVKDFAFQNRCFVILKSALSFLVGPEGKIEVLFAPNSGLSKGGSGDILAGMLLSLLAQKVPMAEAARSAVLNHAYAARIVAQKKNERSMSPLDLLSVLKNLK